MIAVAHVSPDEWIYVNDVSQAPWKQVVRIGLNRGGVSHLQENAKWLAHPAILSYYCLGGDSPSKMDGVDWRVDNLSRRHDKLMFSTCAVFSLSSSMWNSSRFSSPSPPPGSPFPPPPFPLPPSRRSTLSWYQLLRETGSDAKASRRRITSLRKHVGVHAQYKPQI